MKHSEIMKFRKAYQRAVELFECVHNAPRDEMVNTFVGIGYSQQDAEEIVSAYKDYEKIQPKWFEASSKMKDIWQAHIASV